MKTSTLLLSILVSCSAPTLVMASHFPTSPITATQSVADLQDYVGTYRISDLPFDKIVVTTQNGKLHYVAGEYEGDFAEVSGKADTYSANNGEATVTFVRNTEGKVERLRLQIPDGTFEARKEMASAAALTDYVGKYKMEGLDFDLLTLTLKDGQIHFHADTVQGVFTPVAGKADTFDAEGQAMVKFERNAQGKVSKIVVDTQGRTFSGTPIAQ
ncbi:DUF3471 domain-containing protein [Telluribacter sp. SYSU D00476]|uniref:DUF3471 domain-containing protein n=1 Tax=Telluribacter sp. SYSU D00476 TaxID=2811430 RepID=UPI001FF38330|nr:DUF3471 domain-containing protein [Telluribacter sp. SYSU D00476]